MDYFNNTLKTDFKEVNFDFPIKEVVLYKGMYIVLISPLDNLEYPLNVYGVNNQGDIMWKIKSFNGEQIIFDKIEINISNGKLYLKDMNHFKYVVDAETGEILSGKIRPLEEDSFQEDKKSPISKVKSAATSSKNIIDKASSFNPKTILIISFIIIVFLLFKLMGKSIEINSLNKKNTELSNQITAYEEALVLQEQKLKTYEDLILNLRENSSGLQSSQTQNGVTIIDSNQTQEAQENQETTPTREKQVNSGVSTVIDVIDSIIGNVSSGTPTTIEDVNKPKYQEGYAVESIIDGQRMTISDGVETINVKLISVSECKKETLEALFPVGSQVFVETDSKKYDEDGYLLAYVWSTEPNPNNMNTMANYVILKNGYGKFVMESPNIKYNRFFF